MCVLGFVFPFFSATSAYPISTADVEHKTQDFDTLYRCGMFRKYAIKYYLNGICLFKIKQIIICNFKAAIIKTIIWNHLLSTFAS